MRKELPIELLNVEEGVVQKLTILRSFCESIEGDANCCGGGAFEVLYVFETVLNSEYI